ncbi:MAG: aa3-type cytochrome c oxidase subunit IV [Kiloniellaceae bacterium]
MADDQLLHEHQQNWKGFVRMFTVSTVFVVIILALMAVFLL